MDVCNGQENKKTNQAQWEMIIYIVVFALSIYFTFLAERFSKTKNVLAFFAASSVAVLMPSVLAGIRDTTIGYDTQVYGNFHFEMFRECSSMGIGEFAKLIIDGEYGGEWLYTLWAFLSIKYTGDVHWYYFFLNFFVCLFTYMAIYHNRRKASMPLMMFVFLFSFYNISLNVMRQSMALALALFSYHFFEERRWKVLVLLLVMVGLFHGSGVFYVLVLFFIWLQQTKHVSSKKAKWLILLIPFSFALFDPVLDFLISCGIFPQKFVAYGTDASKGGFMAANTLLSLVLYVVLYQGFSKLPYKEKLKAQIYLNNQMLYVMFMFLMLVSVWAFRISYYFYYMNILFVPAYLRILSNNKLYNARLVKAGAVFMIVFIWVWTIVFRGENSTVPYKSAILDGWL